MSKRVQLIIDAETLAIIDDAAADAGESRSKYMRRAALERCGKSLVFTPEQEARIEDIARAVTEKY